MRRRGYPAPPARINRSLPARTHKLLAVGGAAGHIGRDE